MDDQQPGEAPLEEGEEDYSLLVPDEDEEIPDDVEDDEAFEESPHDVLERCAVSTGVEPFEEWKRAVQGWLLGHDLPQRVSEAWSALDQELLARHHFFQEGLRFQEWTEDFVARMRTGLEQFEWLQEQMQRGEAALQAGETLELAYAVEQIRLSLLELQGLYQELRDAQAAEPKFSENPVVAELIRVGHLAAQERLGMEVFLERLHVYCDMQQRLREALESARPAPREYAILQEELPRLQAAFELQSRGIENLLEFAQNGERGLLEQGGEALDETARVLLLLRDRLTGAVAEPELRACPFCGHSNPEGLRFCAHCSARLPERAEFPAPTEGASEARELPSNFQKLSEAVERFQRGETDGAEFARAVAWFRSLHQGASRQLSSMAAVAEDTPGDQLELLEEARELAQTGLAQVEAGLQSLEAISEQISATERVDALSQGLDSVLAGGQKLLELEVCLGKARELADALQESRA